LAQNKNQQGKQPKREGKPVGLSLRSKWNQKTRTPPTKQAEKEKTARKKQMTKRPGQDQKIEVGHKSIF